MPVTWYYSNIDGVKRLIGANNLTIESNLQDVDNAQDDATILADGLASDVLINLRLAAAGFDPVPAVLADWPTHIVGGLALASDHLTAGLLANHRLLYDARSGQQLDPEKVGFTARGYEILDEVIAAMQAIDTDDTTTAPGVFETVDVIDSSEQCAMDENGNQIVPMSWW